MTATTIPTPENLHLRPPGSPVAWLGARPWRPVALAGLVLVSVVLAAYDGGRVLLLWDEPVERFVVSHRYAVLDSFFRQATHLGDGGLTMLLGLVAAALTWHRCPPLAAAVVLATAFRPALSGAVKSLVGRDRPDLDPLTSVDSHAFPSGHVFAATVLWGLLPLVVPLFTERRAVWWGSVALAGTIVVTVAASRVYLGVHWLSDVIAAVVMGVVVLVGVEAFMRGLHGMRPCSASP